MEIKKAEVDAQVEIKKVEVEPDRLRAEAEHIRAQAALLTAQTAATNTKKRTAPTPIDDHWLETQCMANWNGMVSLSSAFWDARPSDYEGGIRDVCQKLSQHIRQIQATSGVRYGLRPLSKTKDVLVYVKADVPLAQHVQELWQAMMRNNGVHGDGQNVVDELPVDARGVIPNMEEPHADPTMVVDGSQVDPPRVIPNAEAPHVDPTMVVDEPQVDPPRVIPNAEEPMMVTSSPPAPQRRRPATAKVRAPPRLPNGAHDLVAAVVGPLNLQTAAERKAAIERLDNEFVCQMEHWAVLWPARSNNREVIPTFIDVKRDPIVAQLTMWLRNTTGEAPPPAYPAVGVVDDRPEEPVPPELQAMDADALLLLQSSCPGIKDLCNTFAMYYRNAQKLTEEPLPSTVAPCNERLRQWKRLTAASAELSYKEIIDCFGWHDIERDSGVVQCITKALMNHQKVPFASWTVKRGGTNMWKHRVCFTTMHSACNYVARIRRGRVPTDKLSYAMRQL